MYNIFSSFIEENVFDFNVKKMKEEILKYKKINTGRSISNYGGWQSNSFFQPQKCFVKLFNNINTVVEKIEKQLHLKNKLKFVDYWYNVNSFGSFNRPHSHEGATLSGVYYINAPTNSGNLCFTRENLDIIYGPANLYNQYNSSRWSCKPEENKCIIFPSYLNHYVEPNLSKKNRISISFNYGF